MAACITARNLASGMAFKIWASCALALRGFEQLLSPHVMMMLLCSCAGGARVFHFFEVLLPLQKKPVWASEEPLTREKLDAMREDYW